MTTISQLKAKLSKQCKEKGFSLVTAESCTGGGLAYSIAKNPICSFVLERGYVVYSIPAKKDVLGISSDALETFGAVSKEISIEMAEKSLKKSKSQISIGITGLDECAAKESRKCNAGLDCLCRNR